MKKIIILVLLLSLPLFAIRDLLAPGFYQSHDAELHLVRMYQFHLSFGDGQIPVRWAPTLYGGLGYPLFIVNYALPYYAGEFFYQVGFGLYGAFKSVMILTFVFSTYLMYRFLRFHFPDAGSLVGAILYTYAPYRFANIFTRGAFGESVAVAFIPVAFIGVQALNKKPTRNAVVIASLSFATLLLAHAVVFVMVLSILVLYAYFLYRRQRAPWVCLLTSLLLAFGISAFQIVPSLLEKKYMQFDEKLLLFYHDHFLSFLSILRIPWPGIRVDSPFQVGGVLAVVIMISGLLLIRKRNIFATFFWVSTAMSIFLITSWSAFIWKGIFGLPYVLYPWRFLSIAIFSASFLGAWICSQKYRWNLAIGSIFVFGIIFAARHYNRVTHYITYPEEYYRSDEGTGTTENEFAPIGIGEKIMQYAYPPVEIINEKGTVRSLTRNPTKWKMDINLYAPSRIKLGLLAFPGWEIIKNDIRIPYDAQFDKYQGLITFLLPEGESHIEVVFHETGIRLWSNILSLISGIVILYIFLSGKSLTKG